MQEAAQMAAWICNYPPDNLDEMRNTQTTTTYVGNHPLRVSSLISQDRNEVYLTFATFGADYVDYIRGGTFDPEKAFLSMHEAGPYDTDHVEQMRNLAVWVSAFARQECPRQPPL